MRSGEEGEEWGGGSVAMCAHRVFNTHTINSQIQ